MPRYVQVQTEDGFKLIEVQKRPPTPRVHLHTARPSYRSPIDGTAIEGRKAERDHMRRHNVVRPGEFGPNDGQEYYERKAKERAEYFTGDSPTLQKEIREDTIKAIEKVSQGYKPRKETVDE